MKRCSWCRREKPHADFQASHLAKDGLQNECRECRKRHKYPAPPTRPSDSLCECGCGQFTNLVKISSKRSGVIAGQPRRFVVGHSTRVAPADVREKRSAGATAFAKTRRGKPNGFSGERHPNWKGGHFVDRRGYVFLYRPDHRLAQSNGYVAEHRLVMEEKLGRPLTKNEQVHHVDGQRANNAPDNLVALTVSAHAKLHRPKEFRRMRERAHQS